MGLSLEYRSDKFDLCFKITKLALLAASVYQLINFSKSLNQFHRQDLGSLQVWIQALLLNLVLFNDPLCLVQS